MRPHLRFPRSAAQRADLGPSVGFVFDVGGGDRLAAVLADHDWCQLGAAGAMADVELGVLGVEEVLVGPCLDGEDGGEQVESGPGQLVLIPVGVGAVADALQESVLDQGGEAGREDIAPDAEVALEEAVAAYAEERLA